MRILLATDGSADAGRAAAWLEHLPLPPGSRLRVVSVVAVPISILEPLARDTALHEAARQRTMATKASLAPRFIESDIDVLEGDPRDAIVRAARTWRADLVVLGARGLGAVAGFFLGSVSLAVARHAPCSVVVVKGDARARRGILIGIDGSHHALDAARFVAALPLAPLTPVRLTGVVQSPAAPATTPAFAKAIVGEGIALIVKDRTAVLERGLHEAAALFAGAVAKLESEVLVGHPAEALLGAATRADVGLIAVGARGLGTVERLLLGSVSETILGHADRSVLIVKGASS